MSTAAISLNTVTVKETRNSKKQANFALDVYNHCECYLYAMLIVHEWQIFTKLPESSIIGVKNYEHIIINHNCMCRAVMEKKQIACSVFLAVCSQHLHVRGFWVCLLCSEAVWLCNGSLACSPACTRLVVAHRWPLFYLSVYMYCMQGKDTVTNNQHSHLTRVVANFVVSLQEQASTTGLPSQLPRAPWILDRHLSAVILICGCA